MVTSVSGNYDNSLLSSYITSQINSGSAAKKSQDSQSTVFQSMLSAASTDSSQAGQASTKTEDSEKTASAGKSEASEKDKTDPADLNKDGTVTAEEAVRYLQMQVMEKMSAGMEEQASSNTKTQEQTIGAKTDSNNVNNSFNTQEFRTKLASAAYQIGQGLLSVGNSAISLSKGLSV